MRRREFLVVGSGAALAIWPGSAPAQNIPVVGFLSSSSPRSWETFIAGFVKGLSETGFIDGRDVRIEYRWAEDRVDELPKLVADLVGRKVALIVAAGGSNPARLAKDATSAIPIVFVSAADPIKAGLIVSLNRPGSNVTGISLLGSTLEAKRLGLLHEILPRAVPIGVLVNPSYSDFEAQQHELKEAARSIGREICISSVSAENEIDAAFANVIRQGAGAILVTQNPIFGNYREQIVGLADRHKLPAIYSDRRFAEIGGLVSYGTDFPDAFRQAGIYAGKILKGARPDDLPVLQPTKFELLINLKTAKALGLDIPPNVVARADEVIE